MAQGTSDRPCPTRPDRPLSLYDNLTTEASGGGLAGGPAESGGQRVIQFPDIQFRFDDNIPATLLTAAAPNDGRRSVHSTAKSDFFGLGPPPSPPPPTPQHHYNNRTPSPQRNQAGLEEVDAPGQGTPPRRQRPASDTPDLRAGASASPDSNASTAPLPGVPSPGETPTHHHQEQEEQETPPTSPRSSLRPKSTIKTITIQLPDASPTTTTTRGSPSEAVYMTTTVPQNFTKNANTLIGRHKPTRSSLRHSRMLVVSKAYPQRYPRGNSLNLRHIRLSKLLMVLQILTGALLSLIGLTVMVWSPSTLTKDNPYWSGLILILCGTLFRVLFEFKRSRGGTPAAKGHQGAATAAAAGTIMIAPRTPQVRWRENCFHVLRVNGLVVLLLTIFFTLLAFIYALIHATNLSSPNLRCEPEFSFNINSSTCVCTIASDAVSRNSSPPPPPPPSPPAPPPVAHNESSSVVDRNWADGTIRLEYRDFNCSEVLGIWYYVTIVSTVLNSIGCLLAATFLVIYGIECMRRDGGDDQRHPSVSRLKANGNNTSSAADCGIAPAVCFTSATTSTNVTNTIDELPSSRPLLMMESGTATTGTDEDAVPPSQQQPSPFAETSVLTTDEEELDTTALTSATLLSQSSTM